MNNEKLIGDLLRSNGLKRTPIRTEMLALFIDHHFALSASDIITKMTAGHDRVTVYRALNSFEEHGILHRASEDSQGVKYALCGHQCPDEQHNDKHAHFVCDECRHTYCLEDIEVASPIISNEFSVDRANLILNGVCKDCKTN